MTDDLVAFLRARLDEDEQTARATRGSRWTYDRESFAVLIEDSDPGWTVATRHRNGVTGEHEGLYDVDGSHIARHDPARVLAEVEAKRGIVDEYEREERVIAKGHHTAWTEGGQSARRTMLRRLALPFAARPDYQQEWSV